MFLLANKALIWVGKGQKEKPIIITTWAVSVSIPIPAEKRCRLSKRQEVGLRCR